jgi:Bifunctional DNA primase/polymerase, N-terminal
VTTLEAATLYTQRGWSVIPIPHRSKNPGYNGWEQTRLTKETVASKFNGHPQNIGVLLGEPSGWLVDVDLNHARCVELADQFLLETPAVFGRAGKARSHRIFRVAQPVATKKFKSKSAGMLVELRSTGMQTVFPPSTHESGEAIEWVVADAEPALIEPDVLIAAVERLANAVKIELGEKAAPKPAKPPKPEKLPPGPKPDRKTVRITERIRTCVGAMMRMKMTDHNDGSGRLFAAACRVVEHDLNDDCGLAAIRDYARQRPFPKDWSDDQILHRIRDAESKVERGVIKRDTAESGKRKVVIDPDEHRVVSESVDVLAADEAIFHRGGVLVRVIREHAEVDSIRREAGTAMITFLPQAALRERLTKYIEFTQFVKRGDTVEEVVTHPTT